MKIYSAPTTPEVHIVCELLKSQRINCRIIGDGIVGLQGEIPFDDNTCPFIWLLDISQCEQARYIIQQYEQQTPSSIRWQCNQCGELNEEQFGLCWKCGEANQD
ncbi:DUF2007 domain-containing protein [Vibrio sp.]|uniref:DUF2007 domain-containing protein n=1 Tax=Vibrio sp. TaxID=678 RepID=UPI00311D5CF0